MDFIEKSLNLGYNLLVGVTGFEPATSRPPAERATKLRHTPIEKSIPQLPLKSKDQN